MEIQDLYYAMSFIILCSMFRRNLSYSIQDRNTTARTVLIYPSILHAARTSMKWNRSCRPFSYRIQSVRSVECECAGICCMLREQLLSQEG